MLLQVFENGASLIVASFDVALAKQEGDLMSYMNELARLNSAPASWQLCKCTANWGQVQVLLTLCAALLTSCHIDILLLHVFRGSAPVQDQ